MPAVNEAEFLGRDEQFALLGAQGFERIPELPTGFGQSRPPLNVLIGSRSGGIQNPQKVQLPPGSVLLGCYADPAGMIGEWWSTPYEINQIFENPGRGGSALFSEGRAEGKGYLHACLVIRREWSSLSYLVAIRVTHALGAYYGEGGVAPNEDQTDVMKGAFITDDHGHRRRCRQLFLPNLLKYQSAFVVLRSALPTDVYMTAIVRLYCREDPLPFEKDIVRK